MIRVVAILSWISFLSLFFIWMMFFSVFLFIFCAQVLEEMKICMFFSTAKVRGKCISIMIIKFKGIIELMNKK